ncbi:MAG: VOC family protein [Campylobacteraceae bacterium]|nr:VOC family protein [Campylobacteraceae bacterium]
MELETIFNVITTKKVKESVQFYTSMFNFEIVANLDWYVHLKHESSGMELAFMQPNHPSQGAMFKNELNAKGLILSFQVKDAKKEYNLMKNKSIDIEFDLKEEEWGQIHFGMLDPNNISIDIVQHLE